MTAPPSALSGMLASGVLIGGCRTCRRLPGRSRRRSCSSPRSRSTNSSTACCSWSGQIQRREPDPAPPRDALIGATALVHDMTVVTRDLEDFQRFDGLDVINPWSTCPVPGAPFSTPLVVSRLGDQSGAAPTPANSSGCCLPARAPGLPTAAPRLTQPTRPRSPTVSEPPKNVPGLGTLMSRDRWSFGMLRAAPPARSDEATCHRTLASRSTDVPR